MSSIFDDFFNNSNNHSSDAEIEYMGKNQKIQTIPK